MSLSVHISLAGFSQQPRAFYSPVINTEVFTFKHFRIYFLSTLYVFKHAVNLC